MSSTNTTHTMTLFVGNNNTANGGTSTGTTTGSTITLGNLNIIQGNNGNTSQTLAVTGANSYRLQIGNVSPALNAATVAAFTTIFIPTSAPLTIAGNVQQTASGGAGSTVTLNLDGTASGNLISGIISNSADGAPKLLNVTKTNSSTWTLSGANTFSGTTTITGGKIILTNALALQNSAYVTTGSTGAIGLDVANGLNAGTLTLGGLGGAVNLATAITGYGSVTNLTLNPQTGASNTYSGIIADGSAGMSLTKTGAGTQTLAGTIAYTGSTTVNAGTLLISGANNLPATGGLSVNAGAHFSLVDGVARTTTTDGGLAIAGGSRFSFDWNAGATDSLTTTAPVATTAGNIVGITINGTSSPSGGPFNLISSSDVGSTLDSATYYLINNSDFTAVLGKTTQTVTIGSYTATAALTSIYWTGNKLVGTNAANLDNAWVFSTGVLSNWSSTNPAYTATGLTPGTTANVIFANNQTDKAQQATVLGADVTVTSVTIDDSVAVSIGGTHTLTLLSTLSTAGTVGTPGSAISVTANATNPTITSRIALGSNQTWNVAR